MIVLERVPAKHAMDWFDRCGGDLGVRVVSENQRYVTMELPEAALRDLVADVEHYIECMGPADTGDIDYRPAARRLLRSLQERGMA